MKFGYHVFTQKSYYEVLKNTFGHKEQINIGYYEENNGTTGEFSLNFNIENDKWIISSCVYTDGYNAFVEFLKAVQNIDLAGNVSPESIIKYLNQYGAIKII